MNIEVTGIFPTYIAHTHVSDHEVITERIIDVMNSVPEGEFGNGFNFWDHTRGDDTVLNSFKNALCAVVSNINSQVEQRDDMAYEVSRSWLVQMPGHYDPPHHHASTKWTAVFYPVAEEGCGDLLLLDPRGGVVAERNDDRGYTNRGFKRVTPKTGSLIVLPGYLMHMVEPSPNDVKRIAFATMFKEYSC